MHLGKANQRPGYLVYVECQADSFVEARRGADDVLHDLKEEWFKPDANGLVMEEERR
jgi:hypothetical protein